MPDIAAFRMLRQEDHVVKNSIGYYLLKACLKIKMKKDFELGLRGRILLENLLLRQKGKKFLAIKYLKISEYIRHSLLTACFSAISP